MNSPIDPTAPETRDERYARQTKEQFEALGRFVQAFEQIVAASRAGLHQLLYRDPKHHILLSLVLHHPAMSSSALMTILRSMIAQIASDEYYGVLESERNCILSIIRYIHDQHDQMAAKRNELLHGTWFIGWAHPDDQDFSEIKAMKLKATGKGLQMAQMPKSVEDLNTMSEKCDNIEFLIRNLTACMIMPGGSIGGGARVLRNFQRIGNEWTTTIQRG